MYILTKWGLVTSTCPGIAVMRPSPYAAADQAKIREQWCTLARVSASEWPRKDVVLASESEEPSERPSPIDATKDAKERNCRYGSGDASMFVDLLSEDIEVDDGILTRLLMPVYYTVITDDVDCLS